jgi:hypothetical protein
MGEIGTGDANWHEGQRVNWLNKFKSAITYCLKYGSAINAKQNVDSLIEMILGAGNDMIKKYEEAKNPIAAD